MRLISKASLNSIKFLFLIAQFLLVFTFTIVAIMWIGTFVNLVAIMWTWGKVVEFLKEFF